MSSASHSQKPVSESKKMDGVDKVQKPEDFSLFQQQVIWICSDRYLLLERWIEWIGRQNNCPDDGAVDSFYGDSRAAGESMGSDLWGS